MEFLLVFMQAWQKKLRNTAVYHGIFICVYVGLIEKVEKHCYISWKEHTSLLQKSMYEDNSFKNLPCIWINC